MKLEASEIQLKLKSTMKPVSHPSPVLENSVFQVQAAGQGDRAAEHTQTRGQAQSSFLPALSFWAWQLFRGFLCPPDI